MWVKIKAEHVITTTFTAVEMSLRKACFDHSSCKFIVFTRTNARGDGDGETEKRKQQHSRILIAQAYVPCVLSR